MNDSRRKSIQALIDQLLDIKEQLETLKDEEQDYFDNMPMSIQDGMKGEAATEAVEKMEEAGEHITDILDLLEEAKA